MLNENIVTGAENAVTDWHRNKLTAERAVNQKGRALGDVKNTLHSHSSSVLDRSKGKMSSNFVANTPMKSMIPIFREESSLKSVTAEVKNLAPAGMDMFETHNHCLCEKASEPCISDDLILKHRLTKEEIDFFGESRNLFQFQAPRLSFTSFDTDVCDIELEEKNYSKDIFIYNILDDLFPVSVPAPNPDPIF